MEKIITSYKWELIKPDVMKALQGALVAGVGAVLTFLQVYFMGLDPQAVSTTLGLDQSFVIAGITAINSVIANVIRKFVSRTNYIIK